MLPRLMLITLISDLTETVNSLLLTVDFSCHIAIQRHCNPNIVFLKGQYTHKCKLFHPLLMLKCLSKHSLPTWHFFFCEIQNKMYWKIASAVYSFFYLCISFFVSLFVLFMLFCCCCTLLYLISCCFVFLLALFFACCVLCLCPFFCPLKLIQNITFCVLFSCGFALCWVLFIFFCFVFCFC